MARQSLTHMSLDSSMEFTMQLIRPTFVLCRLATCCVLLSGCSQPFPADPSSTDSGLPRDLTGVVVKDIQGHGIRLFDAETRGALLIFTSQDCPIANAYVPRILQIDATYAAQGIRCVLVQVDPRASLTDLLAHADAYYHSQLPVIHDRTHQWVRRAAATVTPQAVLFDRQGRTVYSGRIDDQYVAFGTKRLEPTRQDLVDALEAFLAGQPVVPATTRAVGCYIADLAP